MPTYRPLQSLLDAALTDTPQKVAIRCGAASLTYAELHQRVHRLAAGLKERGLQPGDRAAWFLPNSLEAVAITLACYQIGAISLPLNYRYLAPELKYVLEYAEPRLLIFHSDRTAVVEELLAMAGPIETYVAGDGSDSRHTPLASLLASEPLTDRAVVAENDPALILFTSGSTGRPKGVTHSHGAAFAGIDISRRIFDFHPDDIVLVGKPISHAGGLQTQLMPSLQAGAEVILAHKPQPAEAVELIRRYAATQYGMLASDLLDFIEHLEQHPADLDSLRVSIGSGDAVPHDLHHRFRDLFGWEVMEGCGMTEIGGYYAVNPRYGKRQWGSLGLPAPDTGIRIVDANGQDLPAGEVGEIVIRSPSATIGYWQDAAATAALMDGDWLRSGDLARQDEEGYIWFVGRKKLMIVRRGSNIAPAEVEEIIDEHPQVHASIVVGVADPHDGHVPVACVAPLHADDPPTEEELESYTARQIAAYKVPVRFLFMETLPRNSTGKLDRRRIEEIACQLVDRAVGSA